MEAQTSTLAVGETLTIEVPSVSYGYIDKVMWGCNEPNLAFLSQTEASAVIQCKASFSQIATVKLVYVQKYLDSKGFTRSNTYYKEYYIKCSPDGGSSTGTVATGISIQPKASLNLNEVVNIPVILTPLGSNGEWLSRQSNIIGGIVQYDGYLQYTAHSSPGTTTVTVYMQDEDGDTFASSSCEVTISDPEATAPEAISLPYGKVILLDETVVLMPSLEPEGATTTFSRTNSNADVARCYVGDYDVKGISSGQSIITFETANGLMARCRVLVVESEISGLDEAFADCVEINYNYPCKVSEISETSFISDLKPSLLWHAPKNVVKAWQSTDLQLASDNNSELTFTYSERNVSIQYLLDSDGLVDGVVFSQQDMNDLSQVKSEWFQSLTILHEDSVTLVGVDAEKTTLALATIEESAGHKFLVVSWKPIYTEAEVVEVSPLDPSGYHKGYGYVDLGTGVYWAVANVGASAPEESGGYYAFGETSTKSTYWLDYYKYYKNGSYTLGTKNISGTSYDAATAKMGTGWRMPTRTEAQTLLNNLSWSVTTINGVRGFKGVASTGKAIFIPSAGYKYNATTISGWAYVWTGTSYDFEVSYNLYLANSGNTIKYKKIDRSNSHWGLSVRGVVNPDNVEEQPEHLSEDAKGWFVGPFQEIAWTADSPLTSTPRNGKVSIILDFSGDDQSLQLALAESIEGWTDWNNNCYHTSGPLCDGVEVDLVKGTTATERTSDNNLVVESPGYWEIEVDLKEMTIQAKKLTPPTITFIPTPVADQGDQTVKWYTVEGIQVQTPIPGRLYIMKQGAKAIKIIYPGK